MAGEMQKTVRDLAQDERPEPNPLLSLPRGFIDPVAKLIKSYGYAFKSKEALVWKIVDWNDRHGLTAEELVIIEELMSTPEVSREINFEANFFAAFSAKASAVMARRKLGEAQRQREEQDAKDKAEAAPPGELERRSIERWGPSGLGSLFKGVE